MNSLPILHPLIRFKSIVDITVKDLDGLNIKGIALDVDNTLAHDGKPEPFDGVLKWLRMVQDAGIKMIVVSNNSAKRVTPFAEALNLPFVSRAKKPLPVGFIKAARRMDIKCSETAAIGDQIFTDILGANLCGMKSVLVDPRKLETQWLFRIKRYFERPVLRSYDRRHNVKK